MPNNFEDIIYSIDNGVATITINRPEKLNSVTAQSLQEIEAALDAAGKDPEVGVVVLTGTGEKAFCTGADVSWQKQGKMGRVGRRHVLTPLLADRALPEAGDCARQWLCDRRWQPLCLLLRFHDCRRACRLRPERTTRRLSGERSRGQLRRAHRRPQACAGAFGCWVDGIRPGK